MKSAVEFDMRELVVEDKRIHNEKIVDIMENLVEKATKAGKVLGSTFVGTDKCEKWINKGYNFMNIADPLSLGTDKLKSEIERLKNL